MPTIFRQAHFRVLRDVVANPVDVLNLPFKHYLWVGKVLLEGDFAGIRFWKPHGEADIDTEDDRHPYRLTFSVSLPHLPNLFVVPLKIQFFHSPTPSRSRNCSSRCLQVLYLPHRNLHFSALNLARREALLSLLFHASCSLLH
jgi:hypothetical protein